MLKFDHMKLARRNRSELKRIQGHILAMATVPSPLGEFGVDHEADGSCCRLEPWPVTLDYVQRSLLPDLKTAVVYLMPGEPEMVTHENGRYVHSPFPRAAFAQLLSERLASGEWWVFVGKEPAVALLVKAIEEKFCLGEAWDDFDVTYLVWPGPEPTDRIFIAMGHTRRATMEQLRDLVSDATGQQMPSVPPGKRAIVMGSKEARASCNAFIDDLLETRRD
jgi:hypothetical protein